MFLPLVPSLARAPLRILCEVLNFQPPPFLADFLAGGDGSDQDANSTPLSESEQFTFGSTANFGSTTATFNGTMTATQEGFDGTTTVSSAALGTTNSSSTAGAGSTMRSGDLLPFSGRASPATAFLHAMASKPSPNSDDGVGPAFGDYPNFGDNASPGISGGGTFGDYHHEAAQQASSSNTYHNPLVPIQGESPGRFNRRSTLDSVLGEMAGLIRAFEGSGGGEATGGPDSEGGNDNNTANTNTTNHNNALLPPFAAASTSNPSQPSPPTSAWAFAPIHPIRSRSNSGSRKVITPAVANKPRDASPKLRAGTKIITPAEAAQAEYAAAAEEIVSRTGDTGTSGAGNAAGAATKKDEMNDGDTSPSAAASAAAAAAAHPPLPPSMLFTYGAQPSSSEDDQNGLSSSSSSAAAAAADKDRNKNTGRSNTMSNSGNNSARGRRTTPLRRGAAGGSGAGGRRSRSRTGSPSLPRSLSRGPSGRGSSAALFASAVKRN